MSNEPDQSSAKPQRSDLTLNLPSKNLSAVLGAVILTVFIGLIQDGIFRMEPSGRLQFYFSVLLGLQLIVLPFVLVRIGYRVFAQRRSRFHWFWSGATALCIFYLLDEYERVFGNLNLDSLVDEPVVYIFYQLLLWGRLIQIARNLVQLNVFQVGGKWAPPKIVFGQRPEQDLLDPGPDLLKAVVDERRWLAHDLYGRAAEMRRRAVFVLGAIIALILGGIGSIFLAGDLVSSDAAQMTRLSQLQQLLRTYEQEVATTSDQLVQRRSELQNLVPQIRDLRDEIRRHEGRPTPDLDAALARALELEVSAVVLPPLEQTTEDKPDATTEEALSDRTKRRLVLVSNVTSLTEQISLTVKRQTRALAAQAVLEMKLTENVATFLIDTTPKPVDLSLLIASGVTRFGILVVVIFLVQILVGIYRYSLRLAAFYAARGDALIAAGGRQKDLGGWGDDMLPAMIDFGRQPVTPAQYMIDMMRAYLARRNDKKAEAAAEGG